ncbi:MAG: hypothetical protein ACM3SV_13340 [Betaproteobacteria bacterium]
MNPENPFTPPKADVADVPDTTPGSPIKAVLFGFLTDFGGSMLAGIPFAFIYGVLLSVSGIPADEVGQALTEMPPDSLYAVIGYGIGLAFSMLGGFVCARIAKRNEYVLAAVAATLSALSGLLVMPPGYSHELIALLTILSYTGAIYGAKRGIDKNRRGL